MIVLGGLGSVGGAAIGAAIVSALPLVFQQYAGSLPLVAAPGEGGLVASQAARFLYGAFIVLVVMFQPSGLAGLAQRFRRRPRPPADPTTDTAADTALEPPEAAPSAAPGQTA
jgi:branched-chain amino acid transport system permease protein